MALSSFIGIWSESKVLYGGKPCLNWFSRGFRPHKRVTQGFTAQIDENEQNCGFRV